MSQRRVAEIDAELKELRQRKKALIAERERLRERGYVRDSNFWAGPVLGQIGLHPDCSKEELRSYLPSRISEKALTNVLTMLRRNGYIENRGTKKHPRWYKIR